MDGIVAWWQDVAQTLADSLQNIGEYLPILAAAGLVMALGWLVARVLRAALIRLGSGVNRTLERLGRPASAGRLRLSRRLVTLVGNFVFWIAILLFAAAAARVAGLEAFSTWLDRVIDYLPTLVAGVLITLAGYLLSTLVRDVVSTAVASTGSHVGELAGLAAQSTVFVTAIVIGLDQIGIDVTFLIILVAVLLGGALLSLAFAFGFGAREFVGNLIAANHAQRIVEPGTRARIGEVEGRVLEITPTGIVLATEDGRTVVPARLLQQQPVTLLPETEDE